MEKFKLNALIRQVNDLQYRYKKINEITGAEFNIFQILKLQSSEVRLHSAFLAELLNPRGSHGQKDTFLKLFIDAFCFRQNAIDPPTCEVLIEKHTGFLNDDKTEGGKIDILIRDKYLNQIVIENKIYASDQVNQLSRYHKYAKNADIIYLTLDGSNPSDSSAGDLQDGEHYRCISYETHIINWLVECRKEVATLPIIRESITQYINLIKYLTNQTLNNNMEEELHEIIKANLKASFAIKGELSNALQKIADEFGTDLKNVIETDDLLLSYDVNFSKNYTGIWIWKKSWKFVKIGFQFQSKNRNLIYGFTYISESAQTNIPDDLKTRLKMLPGNANNNNNRWWPYYVWLEQPYGNWGSYEAYLAIEEGAMLSIIKDKIETLLNMTQGMEL